MKSMITLSDSTINELKEKGFKIASRSEWRFPEEFRDKKQPEDFDDYTWNKRIGYYENGMYGERICPYIFYKDCFKMIQACKDTDHECQQTNDMAKQIEALFKEHFGIEIFQPVRKRLYEIIESGGKE